MAYENRKMKGLPAEGCRQEVRELGRVLERQEISHGVSIKIGDIVKSS